MIKFCSNKITLNYPAGFFAAQAPSSNLAGTSSVAILTATSTQDTANNRFVITISNAPIPAGTPFTITLAGLTMGAATTGSTTGITVTTDTDTAASAGAPSGGISVPIDVSMTIAAAIKTRKGQHVSWWFYGSLTQMICKP